jgi:hypothetical protein
MTRTATTIPSGFEVARRRADGGLRVGVGAIT